MTEMWSRMMTWGSGVLSRSGGAGRLQGAAEGVLPVNLEARFKTSIRPWCGWWWRC
ncbi:MAG: hypothetical protein RL281_481 [Pseudomonadota bacterium]